MNFFGKDDFLKVYTFLRTNSPVLALITMRSLLGRALSENGSVFIINLHIRRGMNVAAFVLAGIRCSLCTVSEKAVEIWEEKHCFCFVLLSRRASGESY